MASKGPRTRSRRLTPQERKVLSLIAEGCGSKEIASKLGVTIDAVHRHKATLMGKFGLSSISTVIEDALKKGLIDPYEVLDPDS